MQNTTAIKTNRVTTVGLILLECNCGIGNLYVANPRLWYTFYSFSGTNNLPARIESRERQMAQMAQMAQRPVVIGSATLRQSVSQVVSCRDSRTNGGHRFSCPLTRGLFPARSILSHLFAAFHHQQVKHPTTDPRSGTKISLLRWSQARGFISQHHLP